MNDILSSSQLPPSQDVTSSGGQYISPVPERGGRKGLWVAIMVAVGVIVVGGGVVFAQFRGWITIPGLGDKPPTIEEVAGFLKNLKSARVKTSIDLNLKQKQAVSGGNQAATSSSSFLNNILANLKVTSSVTANWQADSAGTDNDIAVTGSYAAKDSSALFGVSLKIIKDKLFFRIDTLQFSAVDASSAIGKWILVPKDTGLGQIIASDRYKVFDFNFSKSKSAVTIKEGNNNNFTDVFKELGIFFDESLTHGAWMIKQIDGKAEYNNLPAWRIVLTADPVKLQKAFNDVYGARDSKLIGINNPQFFTEKNYKLVNGEGFVGLVSDFFEKSLKAEVLMIKKTRQINQVSVNINMSPDAKNGKTDGQEIGLAVTAELSGINEPIIVVEPAETITIQEAWNFIVKQSTDEEKFNNQRSLVENIRTALKNYQVAKGAFPAVLEELRGFSDDLITVVNIPDDIFTGTPFVYTSLKDDYKFEYLIKIPLSKKDSLSAKRFVDGKNTASLKSLSNEADMLNDTDSDGLNDYYEENVSNTSVFSKDTDRDGYTDKQEVDGGFDPLTNSKTGVKVVR